MLPSLSKLNRTAALVAAVLVLVLSFSISFGPGVPRAAAEPTTPTGPTAPAGTSIAKAPAGSALRAPFVAEAKKQAAGPQHKLTGKWVQSTTPVPLCDVPAPGRAGCLSIGRRVAPTFSAAASTSGPTVYNSPSDPDFFGYEPADLQAAYGTSAITAAPLVAIVDAYDDPTAEQDLVQYRDTFGLPACTTGNACFTKVNQTGGATPPGTDGLGAEGWIGEISLDLDAVSAVAPTAHILLVEANSDNDSDLYAAVQEAVKLGAKYVSMSWGASEGALVGYYGSAAAASTAAHSTDSTVYGTAGVSYVASTGDDAYRYDATTEPLGGLDYPASSPNVIAAGGDALNRDATSGAFRDNAWSWDTTTPGCQYTYAFQRYGYRCSGAGSGCSQLEPAQSWQQGSAALTAVCSTRAGADVSADADPATGLLVDVDGFAEQVGGTSLAAPLLASLYALTGETAGSVLGAIQSVPFGDPSRLIDVTSGATGNCGNALCTAGSGWDGPTGLGAPNSPSDLAHPSTVAASWPSSFTYGKSSTIKVTVSAIAAPTGTVALKDGSTTVVSAKLSGSGTMQSVTLTAPATKLTAGRHSLTVGYSGGGTVAATTLAAHTVSVAKATPTVSATWPTSFQYGTKSTVKVSVSATGVAPTGTVALKSFSTTLASATLTGTGTTRTASLSVAGTKLPPGSHGLTLAYAGSTNVAAKSINKTVSVAKAASSVAASWPSFRYGVASTIHVTVRSSVSPSTKGKVAVKWGSTTLGTAAVPSGSATSKAVYVVIHTSKLTAGKRPLVVSYSGDADISSKTLGAHTVTVAKATPTVKATWPSSIAYSHSFSVKVSVTASGVPTGTVSLKSGSTLLTKVTLPTSSTGTKTVTATVAGGKLSRGSHKLTVSYSGDANVYAHALAAHSVTVK